MEHVTISSSSYHFRNAQHARLRCHSCHWPGLFKLLSGDLTLSRLMRLLDHALVCAGPFSHSLINVEAVFDNLPGDCLFNAGQGMSSPVSRGIYRLF